MNVAPFQLPAESVEIVLDLPFPPSVNELWAYGGRRVRRSDAYVSWLSTADQLSMALRQYPKRKIHGPFSAHFALRNDRRQDGDNSLKAPLDWCQSRDIIRNDRDCRKGSWEWVEPEQAPEGLRLTLRSLHGDWQQLGDVASRVIKKLEKSKGAKWKPSM